MKRQMVMASLASLVLLSSACSTQAPMAANFQPATTTQVQQTTNRDLPRVAAQASTAKKGLAARDSSDAADRALSRYNRLLSDWDYARSDREKDRIEMQMLDVLYDAVKDVQEMTSNYGHDREDRRAYDIADRARDQYESLRREYDWTFNNSRKREIVNDMLSTMVSALKKIRDNA